MQARVNSKPAMCFVSRHKVKGTLCGSDQHPSERIRVGLAKFKAGLHALKLTTRMDAFDFMSHY